MPIKIYKPTTAGRRNSNVNAYAEITKTKPEKSLIERRKKTGGRNHTGWITCRHIGGGNKQFYRKIDFKRVRVVLGCRKGALFRDERVFENFSFLQCHNGYSRK
jgi:ribosomal protein L2